MAETRLRTIGKMLKQRSVRVWLGLVGALGTYDLLSSQFELPTIRALWGMSGSLMPWWGWLLVLQAIVVYALFEYVRRNVSPGVIVREAEAPLVHEVKGLQEKADQRLNGLELRLNSEVVPKIDQLAQRADKLNEELKGLEPSLRRFERLADLKDAQERYAMLEARLKEMRSDAEPPSPDVSFTNGNDGKAAWMNFQGRIMFAQGRFMAHRMALDSMGFAQQGRDEAMAKAEAKIRGDAIHAVLQEDEIGKPWADAAQKRFWKLAEAPMRAQIDFYAKELERLRGQASWASSNVGA